MGEFFTVTIFESLEMEGCDNNIFFGVEKSPTELVAVKSEKKRHPINGVVESSLIGQFGRREQGGVHGMGSKEARKRM
jgi:hypothetical protein